jgi:hypothetical protein
MNQLLDVIEAQRAILDAVDLLVEDAQRVRGSVESQRAAGLARRARQVLDGVVARALQAAG